MIAFKEISGRVYVTYQACIDAGLSKNTVNSAKMRNKWKHIDDPEDKRKVLFDFDTLAPRYREMIEQKFGDAQKTLALQPIRDRVKRDDAADKFYTEYEYEANTGRKHLPEAHIDKYTMAASWLNMIRACLADKRAIKTELNVTIEKFWAQVCECIERDGIDLPSSYDRLRKKLDEYEAKGYASLIDWRFGTRLSAKVKDDVSESVLKEMIANGNQHDDVFLAMQYNRWAVEAGYKPITAHTVGHWRRQQHVEIVMEREGNAKLRNQYLKQVKSMRPSAPGYLYENDDNHLDLLFEDPENPKATRRYLLMLVTDSFNDYPLGYSYALMGSLAEEQTLMMVRAAYANAMYYVRGLTGGWYLPHEIKNDRWGMASLEPFYKGIGKWYPTPVGSKNGRYIEAFFGTPHWKRCLKLGANNYSGNNVTALARGVNMEQLARNKKSRPMIGLEAERQIENFIHRLRHLPQSNGQSKHEQWMAGWQALGEDKKRAISDEQFLLKFGIRHPEPNTITNKGLKPMIGGVRYNYDMAEYDIRHIGKSVTVIYDPFDMSRVLATDNAGLRMMAHDARLTPRALEDCRDTNARLYVNATLEQKQRDVEWLADKAEKRKQILAAEGIDAETILQAGVLVKELKAGAETRLLTGMMNQTEDDLYEQM